MTPNEITKGATKVFNAIKSALKERKSVKVDYYDEVKSVYDKAAKCWKNGDKTYKIWVAGKEVLAGIDSMTSMGYIFNEVRKMLDGQKKVKGWSTLNPVTECIRHSSSGSNWVVSQVIVLTKVDRPDAPCKEYKSLENYLNKYGLQKKSGYWGKFPLDLTPFRLFSVYAGGKRGYLYGEEGTRHYLANKPNKCKDILAELRKHRTSKDTITCEYGHEEYIDPMEQRYSSYHEVECDGEIREYLTITIKNPNEKVKYTTKIY